MTTQEKIQTLINEQLITNAKMQAHDHNWSNLGLLLQVAIGRAPTMGEVINVGFELNSNPEFY